jgi:hypothetical protein
MAFIYIDTGEIVDADDEGVIASLVETVSEEDGFKMAAAPELFDALEAILYAHEIGEAILHPELVRCGQEAISKATWAPDGAPCVA